MISIISLFLFFLASNAAHATGADSLAKGFVSPKPSYGPHVFWHWINGNVRAAALDDDVNALYKAGHGGAMIYDVNAGLPQGPITYGSSAWLENIQRAVKGLQKKGMLAAMHNAPGYSGIGSPDLPVNMTMKELVWTESRAASNGSKIVLPNPFSKLGLYEDLFTFAYPVLPGEGTVFRDAVKSVSIDGTVYNTNITKTINRDGPLRLNSSSSILDISMKDYFTAQAIAIYRIPETPKNTFDGKRDYPPSWTLKVSNDSSTWSSVTVFGNYPALREMDAPAVLTFSPVVAKYLRLQPSGSSWITGIDISSSARLSNWAVKAHGAPGTNINPASIANVTSSIALGDIIDVTDHMDSETGELNWSPANGTYTVVRMGYTATGQEMPATPDAAYSLSVDLFSKSAIDAHFETHLNKVIKALKRYIPDTFYGFEVDSYELGQQNWGGNLETEFFKLRGYSLRPWVLAATGRVIKSAKATEQFLYDFRLTHANMMASNCYGYFSERLNDVGLALLVEPYGDGPFDGLELAAAADIAYGEFWSHYTYGSDGYSMLGSSSADFKTMNLLPAEAFTGQPDDTAWTEHPYQLKADGDRMMTFGTNRFYLHSYVHQPVDIAHPGITFGPFGAHFDRMNTWAEQAVGWNEYLARVSYVMQSSQKVSEIGCFTAEEPTASAVVTYNAPYYVPLAYQADLFSRSGLLNMTPSDGKATYPSGKAFSLLVFPSMPSASLEVLAKIKELAEGGVKILLLGPTSPSRSLSLADSDSEVLEMAGELWAMSGDGAVITNTTVAEAVVDIGIDPDLTFSSSSNDAAIYYIHKKADKDHIYFVSNGLRRGVDVTLDVQGTGAPEIWDPLSGDISETAIWSQQGGRTLISFQFAPSESIIIRLQPSEMSSTSSIARISKDGVTLAAPEAFSAFSSTPWLNVSASFTVMFWAKPEIFQVGTTGYVFYPTGASSYGSGHALSSITMGCNGIQLHEMVSSLTTVVTLTQSVDGFTLSGWTHVAVVYSENTPSLFINGELVKTGLKSANVVHPGLDTTDSTAKMNNRFVGDIAGMLVFNESLSSSDVSNQYLKGLPDPPAANPFSVVSANEILVRQNGNYTVTTKANITSSFQISGIQNTTIQEAWKVTFPVERLPLSYTKDLTITLPSLISLKKHSDFDVSHFAGTAVYETTFAVHWKLSASSKKKSLSDKYLLTLGRVENIASVTLNGKSLGLSWLPPYELDITAALKLKGKNALRISVTNTWPNRLIGDESLPSEATYNSTTQDYSINSWPDWYLSAMNSTSSSGRDVWGNAVKTSAGFDVVDTKPGDWVTFAAWRHYNSTDPLFESGLLGPVVITKAVLINRSG
jgi:hypothetical protein